MAAALRLQRLCAVAPRHSRVVHRHEKDAPRVNIITKAFEGNDADSVLVTGDEDLQDIMIDEELLKEGADEDVDEAVDDDPEFDDFARDLEHDPVQEQRALREDKYQADQNLAEMSGGQRQQAQDDWDEKIVQLKRVTKVLKGGKVMKFRVCMIAGDRKGHVGYGVASAREVVDAVARAGLIARRNSITVPMVAGRTFPHKIQVKEGAARVMLRPASEGTGVIAGGAVRVVLELAGYQNAFGKIYGTNSPMNNARGTIAALSQMFMWKGIAEKRNVTIDFAMGRVDEPDQIAAR